MSTFPCAHQGVYKWHFFVILYTFLPRCDSISSTSLDGFQSCFKPRWIMPLNIHVSFHLVSCIWLTYMHSWTFWMVLDNFSEGSAESFLCVHRIFLLHGFQTGQDPVITSASETWFCQFTICHVRIWLKAIIIIRNQNPLANLINCITAYETPKASFPSGYYCGKTLLWSFPIIL